MLKTYRYILAIDPSGNFSEGKGITGWVLFDTMNNKVAKFGYISADKYNTQQEYWDAHIDLLDSIAGFAPKIVIEDYLLYGGLRAESQYNSRLETPQLIGVIKYECYKRGYDPAIQMAVTVKTRWSDDILVKKGYLNKNNNSNKYYIGSMITCDHVRDALRHAVHYATYGKETKSNGRKDISKRNITRESKRRKSIR